MTEHLFAGSQGCSVCGRTECRQFHHAPYLSTYPFLPGGIDPMAGKAFVITPHRLIDHEAGRIAYGTGDRVPLDDAVRFGLIEETAADTASATIAAVDAATGLDVTELTVEVPAAVAEQPAEPKRGKRRGGNRAHGPSEDRSAEDDTAAD